MDWHLPTYTETLMSIWTECFKNGMDLGLEEFIWLLRLIKNVENYLLFVQVQYQWNG